jgi:hypothetical protein
MYWYGVPFFRAPQETYQVMPTKLPAAAAAAAAAAGPVGQGVQCSDAAGGQPGEQQGGGQPGEKMMY